MKFITSLALFVAAAAAAEADAEAKTETDKRGALYHDDAKAQDYLGDHGAYVPLAKDFTDGQRAKFVRGDKKVARRRAAPSTARNEGELIPRKDLHKGRTYDWREYAPDLHKGVDPYAHCPMKAGDRKHLDGPEYQSMSAECKEEMIWQNILGDGTRQHFFTGPEF